jgi:hypothetical protein
VPVLHVCQDQFGMWFLSVEEDDGRVWLHSHAGTREDMLEEASRISVASTVIEKARKPWPKGGAVTGYHKPAPRKAVP